MARTVDIKVNGKLTSKSNFQFAIAMNSARMTVNGIESTNYFGSISSKPGSCD